VGSADADAADAARDMVAEFEAVSVKMSQPDADLDALTNKMGRLQVRRRCSCTIQM
jgi:hypothetical protein